MLQEHIVRAKKTRHDLLDESQKRLRMRKVEECKAKYPWIARNIDLEKELDEIKEKCKQYVLVINWFGKEAIRNNEARRCKCRAK
jgi:hypothetical protein